MSLSCSAVQGEENLEENKAKLFAFSRQERRSSTRVKRRDDDQYYCLFKSREDALIGAKTLCICAGINTAKI